MKWYETSPTVRHSTWTPIAEGMATRGQQATCCPRLPPLPPAQSHPLHLLDAGWCRMLAVWRTVNDTKFKRSSMFFFNVFLCLWRRHRQILHRTICIKNIWTSSPGMLPAELSCILPLFAGTVPCGKIFTLHALSLVMTRDRTIPPELPSRLIASAVAFCTNLSWIYGFCNENGALKNGTWI